MARGRQAGRHGVGAHLSDADIPVVDSDTGLTDLVDTLAAQERVALDTEFHRESTYFPDLALLQVAWPTGLAVVDPLAVDIRPFVRVLEGDTTIVVHAADQDLEVLLHACGRVPARLFDTQVAAGFLGWSQPGLSNLLRDQLGVKLPKGDRLTDWLRRPLTPQQLRYAAADVEHLLDLHDDLVAELTRRGRLEWLVEECEDLRHRAAQPRPAEDAWLRIRGARRLRGRAAGIAREVAAWRDGAARRLNRPVGRVLPDLAVVAIAQAAPATPADLRRVRGIDGRHLKGEAVEEILAAIRAGADARPPEPPAAANVPGELRPAIALIAAWVAERGRELDIDPPLLATRADLEALVGGQSDTRLASGWRADVVTEPIRRLLAGEAALAFEQGRGLVLEDRGRD